MKLFVFSVNKVPANLFLVHCQNVLQMLNIMNLLSVNKLL